MSLVIRAVPFLVLVYVISLSSSKKTNSKSSDLDTLDYEQTAYITEGPFDSLLLTNAIAMAGADGVLPSGVRLPVYVYDNEPRNTQITARIIRHISDGDSVVIWPSSIKEKDINDMFLAGHDVQEIVSSCTYSGLTATLKFNDWRK